MSHAFHNYLAGTLCKMLRDRRVAVFYDPRQEFRPFVEEFSVAGAGIGGLPRIIIADTVAHLATFESSFFTLKAAIEPVVEADKPEPLLVYVPGVERDREGSVLMELECAGACYEPQLRRLARNLMRRHFTDGDIDEMLKAEPLTYTDVVRFLGQAGTGTGAGSVLKLVLGSGSSEALLTKWLAESQHDNAIAAKQATDELYKLVHARLGLELGADADLTKARHQTFRYVLVNEFRADLDGTPPATLAVVPEPPDKDAQQRLATVATALRKSHGEVYATFADRIEQEFALASASIDAASLGSVDTFRFEELALLTHVAGLLADRRHNEALAVIADRTDSFWVDLKRQAQWEACRLVAELGQLVAEAAKSVKKTTGDAGKWVHAYADDGGWFRIDRAQRALESWVARMEDDPEAALEKAIQVVRRDHEMALREMAKGFSTALVAAKWSVPDVLAQTNIYPELVESRGGRVAYFFVDAMRFEMGSELVEQLSGGREVRLQPAVAVLPSITPMGMAALLPGASASYSVVEHKNKLASKIGDHVMPDLAKRMKYLKAVRPDARDIDLGELLQKSTAAIKKKLADANLVVVRSQSIDALGEMDGGLLARQIMDTVVGNVARGVRKLARAGIEHFVVTSDHGHQFAIRKTEDMLMDKPGGDTVDQHRRSWAGRGGQTTAANVRVTGADLGYQTDLDFIFPRGLAVFRAGGDLAFHHGGISLQEMVVPVVTLRMPMATDDVVPGTKVAVEGYPKVLTNRVFSCKLVYTPDMFGDETLTARVVLISDGQEVGRIGMASGVELDRAAATVQLPKGKEVGVGIMLAKDDTKKLRVVLQDPATDAVLAQSDEITVGDLL